MSEGPPKQPSWPTFEAGEYPTIPTIEDVSSEQQNEIERRLEVFMDALPRLKSDIHAQCIVLGQNKPLDTESLSTILSNVSLRPESILDWDSTHFDEQLNESIRIAKERGSHSD